jgi:hypothetical protein
VRIPKFWAAAEGSGSGPRGERVFRRVWGWSSASAADALAVAQERLRSALADLRSGTRVGGYYPRVPLREPILDELAELEGGDSPPAVVTRNRYGAEVLNTDRLLIADVDLPELEDPGGGGLLRRLFGRSTPQPGEPTAVTGRLATIAGWASANPGLGVVVHRTASGLRVFVTGAPADESQRILTELGTDPIYRELCRAHGTFRARLTPKPWRLPGLKAPRQRWPFADAAAEAGFQRWLTAYDTASAGYAVCRRLAAYGPGPSSTQARIMRLHDDRTGVATTLPLA